MDAPDLSVILPTRNRAGLLPGVLDRLAAQQTGGQFTFEVIVIENACTDGTRAIAEARQGSFPVPLRVLSEPMPGKSHALNTGIRAARGTWLAFFDDDIVTPPDWLAALWRCANEEPADAVTGRVLPLWEAPLPAWLEAAAAEHINQMGIGCIDHGPARRHTARGQDCRWVGGNMAVRRESVLAAGPFSTSLIRGEDSEYYYRCVARGLRIVYEPAATARHRVGAERLTPEAMRRWRHRQGRFEATVLPWKPSHILTVMPLWRWRTTLAALGAWLAALAGRRSRWDRFYAELKLREQLGGWAQRLSEWPGRRRAHG
jgi:glycosyltransferase involved in cell wall biosynthesis